MPLPQQQFLDFGVYAAASKASDFANVVVDGLITEENNPRLAECLRRVKSEITKLADDLHEKRTSEIRADDILLHTANEFKFEASLTGIRMAIEGKKGFVVDHMSDEWKLYSIASSDYYDKFEQRAAMMDEIADEMELWGRLEPTVLTAKKVCGILTKIEKAKSLNLETTEAFKVLLTGLKSVLPEDYHKDIDQIVGMVDAPDRPCDDTLPGQKKHNRKTLDK